MRLHPGLFMLIVWSLCATAFFVLPFQLLTWEVSLRGALLFILFILVFVFGTVLYPVAKYRVRQNRFRRVDFSYADLFLKIICVVAIFACLMDILGGNALDLTEAYSERSERAGDLLRGNASSSSIAFQISFITYPAAFVFIVRRIVFDIKVKFLQILLFGYTPIVLAMLSMGGRAPLLYAIIISVLALLTRKHMNRDVKFGVKKLSFITKCIALAIPIIAMSYFVAVFLVRAETAGGGPEMLKLAETVWGVGFKGPYSEVFYFIFSEEVVYLIFAFVWYLVQGLVMSNVILTSYDGPMQMGIYGIDLVAALMRRLDGETVGIYFNTLFELGTYGFLPSAFGSLYVDLGYGGYFIVFIWGALVGMVYQKIRKNSDGRWFLLAPFIVMGLIFSVINTPLGFTNGFMTHFYLLIAFFMSRDPRARFRS